MELIVDHVTKRYGGRLACDGVSFTLKKGVYGLLGANGAGKTTLMRMICGVLLPTSGTVSYNGVSVQSKEYRDDLGYLPQDFGYYPEFTAQDFLLYIAALKGIPKARAKARTAELLEAVSLENAAKKRIRTFSGGMKQRLGIAQALLGEPKILVLDEPTAGLDPKERVRFRNILSRMGADRIILVSTHIVSDVESIADEILMMKGGQIIRKDTRKDILADIQNRVWECTVDLQTAETLGKRYPIVNTRPEGPCVFLRLVCDTKPCAGAAPVPATLEDLYLTYFQ